MTTRMFEEGANDMEITISVSKEAENILAEKASVQGKDIKTFIEGMITTEATHPTLDEILAPVRRDFAQWHDRRRVGRVD